MPHKQTIAVIGASRPLGAFLANAIALYYRVLLMDENTAALNQLQHEILAEKPEVEVETHHCCKDASWEADIILVAVPVAENVSVATKMKEVATCKIILNTGLNGNVGNIQQHLPHSKVVNIFINDYTTGQPFNTAGQVLVEGHDDEAVETALFIMTVAGFNAIPGKIGDTV